MEFFPYTNGSSVKLVMCTFVLLSDSVIMPAQNVTSPSSYNVSLGCSIQVTLRSE